MKEQEEVVWLSNLYGVGAVAAVVFAVIIVGLGAGVVARGMSRVENKERQHQRRSITSMQLPSIILRAFPDYCRFGSIAIVGVLLDGCEWIWIEWPGIGKL